MGDEKGGNVLKCAAEESSRHPVIAPLAFCEEGKGCSDWSSGGPIMDLCLGDGHCSHGGLGNGRMGLLLGKEASFMVRDRLGGVVGAQGSLLPRLLTHSTQRVTNPAVHVGTRTRTSKKRMFVGGNTGSAATQEPEQLTKSFSCCSLGPFKWHAKIFL